jgi:tetratricopeptide (TPR) repeat protein
VSYADGVDRLTELAASIGRDPTDVARQARELAGEAREAERWADLSRAQAVAGRALRMLGEIELAADALTEAVSAAERAGDDDLAADAHLASAGVASIAGRWPQAFEHLDAVDRLGSAELRGIAELQRAVVCRDVGQVDEALRLFARAVPRLRRQARRLDLARVLANRGNIRASSGEFDAAMADYVEAEQLYLRVGQEFAALQARHDRACAVANTGDLPQALRLFDDVTKRFQELGHDASVPLLSRAEALLQAGLSADALTFAADAARRLRADGHDSAAAQALVALAEAGRLEEDYTAAIDAAERARRWFAANQACGWERTAALEAIRSRHATEGLREVDIEQLERIACQLADAGDLRGAVQARCMAALVACRNGRADRAREHSSMASRLARRSQSLQTRLAVFEARVNVQLLVEDFDGARRDLRRALAALDTAEQLHGAGDVGTALITQARSITTLADRLAGTETQPMRALAWMDRARLAEWSSLPAATPADDSDALGFARLRAIATDLRHAESAGEPTGDLRRRHAELEQSMRAEWMKLAQPSTGSQAAHRLGALKGVLGDAQLVSIAADGESFVAIVVNRRRARSVRLDTCAHTLELVRRTAAALRGAATSATTHVAARERSFAHAVDALDAALLARLDLDRADVVLVVPPELHGVPWAAMPSLRRRSFTLAPSISWWIDAAFSASAAPTSAVVVAGPRLAEADAEARRVARCYQSSTLLTGSRATIARLRRSLSGHDVLHLVAHGTFRHDNPMWSRIELVDGPMTVYEMLRMGPVPSTIVLASCESAHSITRGGAQLHGLAGTLLRMGARTVVASIGALPDNDTTRRTMVALHHDLTAGQRASESLARSRATDDGHVDITAASLVTVGVG